LDAKFFIPVISLFASCAQPVVPTGGDKDQTGPKLNSVGISRGTSTTVTLAFNENVVVEQTEHHIILSPAIRVKPDIKLSQHSISLRFDTLLPDNFYIKFFPGSIQDLNEKNHMQDTIIHVSGNRTLDSVPDTYTFSGTVRSSYQFERIPNLSVYAGEFQPIHPDLSHKPFTKTDKSGNFELAVTDTLLKQIILLQDKNQNHFIDSGEIFNLLPFTRPSKQTDTSTIYYLPIDLPVFKPKAERVYFGYRISGTAGFDPAQYTAKQTANPAIHWNDTTYIVSDSVPFISFNAHDMESYTIPTTKQRISIQTEFYQRSKECYDTIYRELLFNKPILRCSGLKLLTASKDSIEITPDIESQGPFKLLFKAPFIACTHLIIPDSTLQFSDGSFLRAQLVPFRPCVDRTMVTFRKSPGDQTNYLLYRKTKNFTSYRLLTAPTTHLFTELGQYNYLIIQDDDKNGFVTPSKLYPFKEQEYHYAIPDFKVRKNIENIEIIIPKP